MVRGCPGRSPDGCPDGGIILHDFSYTLLSVLGLTSSGVACNKFQNFTKIKVNSSLIMCLVSCLWTFFAK